MSQNGNLHNIVQRKNFQGFTFRKINILSKLLVCKMILQLSHAYECRSRTKHGSPNQVRDFISAMPTNKDTPNYC